MDFLDPKLPYYVVISIVAIGLGQLFECLYLRAKREKDAHLQRELYHRKLQYESLKIEREKLKNELESLDTIQDLLKKGDELQEQLRDDSEELNDFMFNNKLERLSNELNSLRNQQQELISIDEEISIETEKLLSMTGASDSTNNIEDLVNHIKNLEDENQNCTSQLNCHKVLLPNCKVDPDVFQFVNKHEDELTLDFLEKAYDILLELKATNPSNSFDKYIEDILNKEDHVTELAQLRVENKQAEIRLKLMKQRYDDELNLFNDIRVEYLFKICGARQLLGALKGKSDIKRREVVRANLEKEFETKKSERIILQEKLHDADKQCRYYWQASKDIESKREQLEVEQRANMERRFLEESMNSRLSNISGSSRIPPPITVPSVDEILRLTANQSVGSNYSNFCMDNEPIPSPPPIEVPLDEIFGNRSINTKQSNISTNSTGGGSRTRVGSHYGRIMNSRSGGLGE